MSKNCLISALASAPDGTKDAAILAELVSCYGEYLERLNSEQKLALRAVLSYYLFYKLKVVSDYSVRSALTDAMPEYTLASISKIILTLEGISSDATEGLIRFITEQRSSGSELPGKAAVVTHHNHQHPLHSQKLSVVGRLAALQDRLQQIGHRHQADFEAVNRELKILKASVSEQRSWGGQR